MPQNPWNEETPVEGRKEGRGEEDSLEIQVIRSWVCVYISREARRESKGNLGDRASLEIGKQAGR